MSVYRTHTCGQLKKKDINQVVKLSGWVHSRRDHGGIVFIDLRDQYGLTQISFDPEYNKEAWIIADSLRSEFVITVEWRVRERPTGQANPNLITGEIEVIANSIIIHSKAKTPPFELDEHSAEAGEEIRLKYRYLDLRRKKQLAKIEFRSKVMQFARNWFTEKGFLEIQTPLFTISSPEGARDYLVPSRVNPGKFYALPQAPQQYKQLAMVAGIDKYYQIAPCFRDEDPRSDRHACEFYQIDAEMSFVERDDLLAVVEQFSRDLVASVVPHKTVTADSFQILSHQEALDRFGSDKPDMRFGMEFINLTDIFKETDFTIFKQVISQGGVIKAIKLEGKTMSRKEIDDLTKIAQSNGLQGLAYIIYDQENLGGKSPILKFFSQGEIKALQEKTEAKVGDVIFFAASTAKIVANALNNVRLALRDKFELADKNELAFCWVTDFPLYMMENNKIDFEHNPFSMPQGGLKALKNKDPLDIYCSQFDLALNGYEQLSGAIRNHNPEILVEAFKVAGYDEKEIKRKFGALYNAFQYGAPPHGGFAFGVDRLIMTLLDEKNIKEIYAFPKSGKAQDVMMGAPSEVDEQQLKELHITLNEIE